MDEVKYFGYMDGTDFLHECGFPIEGSRFFSHVDDLKEELDHDLTECGIAKVEIRFVEWIQEPKTK